MEEGRRGTERRRSKAELARKKPVAERSLGSWELRGNMVLWNYEMADGIKGGEEAVRSEPGNGEKIQRCRFK